MKVWTFVPTDPNNLFTCYVSWATCSNTLIFLSNFNQCLMFVVLLTNLIVKEEHYLWLSFIVNISQRLIFYYIYSPRSVVLTFPVFTYIKIFFILSNRLMETYSFVMSPNLVWNWHHNIQMINSLKILSFTGEWMKYNKKILDQL